MGSKVGYPLFLTGIGGVITAVLAMLTLKPEDMDIGYLFLGISVFLVVVGGWEMLRSRGKRADRKIPSVVVQESVGLNSPNILGDHNQLIINPDVNPNAPVVTYDFNGIKRTVSFAPVYRIDVDPKTPQHEAFQAMAKVQEGEDWQLLRELSEQELQKTPEWLTPHLFAAVANISLGEIDAAIKSLDYVQEKAAGRQDYAQADSLRAEIRKRYGK
jgi:hypothetical protein